MSKVTSHDADDNDLPTFVSVGREELKTLSHIDNADLHAMVCDESFIDIPLRANLDSDEPRLGRG